VGRRDGKTEKASPRRRSEARKKGQIARSQEVAVAGTLLATAATLQVFSLDAFEALRGETALLFANLPTDVSQLGRVTPVVLRIGLRLLVPFLVVGVVTAFVSQVVQVGLSVKPKAAMPSLRKLSIKQGLERLRPSKSLWDLAKTAAKLALLTAVVVGPVRQWADQVTTPWSMDSGLAQTGSLVSTVLLRAAALAGLVAAADYVWNRRSTDRDMRMSKDEVRREHKDNEGDPHIKGKRRQRAMELSRNRMLVEVSSADVIVTNPTHLAIALRYVPGDVAPRVVAKGADHLAARIRKEAYRNGVQVIEDKPLARVLYRTVKVGGFVPAALFEAVAVVLATAYRRYGRVVA
jgi:flagellar biosynthesis protein FlhB